MLGADNGSKSFAQENQQQDHCHANLINYEII